MAYNVTGTNGNDVLNQAGDVGPGTVVGLAGDDCIFSGSGLLTIVGDFGQRHRCAADRQHRHGQRRHRE